MIKCISATHLQVFCQQHLHPATGDGVAEAGDGQVVGVEELVYEEGEEGSTLGQVDGLQTLQASLHLGRLQQVRKHTEQVWQHTCHKEEVMERR